MSNNKIFKMLTKEDIECIYSLGEGDVDDDMILKRKSVKRVFTNQQALSWELFQKISKYLKDKNIL